MGLALQIGLADLALLRLREQRFLREVMDSSTAQGFAKFMVAENRNDDRDKLLAFLQQEGRPVFHMTLNFPLPHAFTRLDAATAKDFHEWGASLPANRRSSAQTA